MSLAFPLVCTEAQIDSLVHLAGHIWRQHYPAIISHAQIEYMLDRFQSKTAISAQIAGGACRYHLICKDERDIGYLAFERRHEALFLSKIYVCAPERGQGVGRQSFAFVQEWAVRHGCKRIWLTVNRHNRQAIRAYDRWGFTRVGTQVQSIGGGYLMDDYRMECLLSGDQGAI
jgi:GNAT superfamily N-acetyltransferase